MVHYPCSLSIHLALPCAVKFKMADQSASEGSELPIYVINAFTDKPFGGNPAAVCLPGHKVLTFSEICSLMLHNSLQYLCIEFF